MIKILFKLARVFIFKSFTKFQHGRKHRHQIPDLGYRPNLFYLGKLDKLSTNTSVKAGESQTHPNNLDVFQTEDL